MPELVKNKCYLFKDAELKDKYERLLFIIIKIGTKEIIMGNLKKGKIIATTFSNYSLEQKIGEGGNGIVWSAKDESFKEVAIKFIKQDSNEKTRKRFKNEIFFCLRHNHKNIVPIKDYGISEGYIFYVMPLYSETLKNKMEQGINPKDIITIFIGILEGLKFAHEKNIIHRDIKPENILFKENSNDPVIADFGIAHFPNDLLETVIETKRTDRMANFKYAAPEQKVKGGRSMAQTDIYAVALILNEMFTGEIPQAADYTKIANINEEYKFLDEIFSQMFRQRPEDRIYPEEKIITKLQEHFKMNVSKAEEKVLENNTIYISQMEENNLKMQSVLQIINKNLDDKKRQYHQTAKEGVASFDFKNNSGEFFIGSDEFEFCTMWSECGLDSIYAYSDKVDKIGYLAGINEIPELQDLKGFDFTSRTREVYVGEVIVWINNKGKIAATLITNVSIKNRGAEQNNLSFKYKIF